MNDIELLHEAARLAVEYVAGTDGRPATPDAAALAGLDAFDEPLPDGPTDPSDALRLLSEVADPATMVSTGPNYYGFVNGATFPVALGAAFLVNAWDQNAALPVMSPAAAKLHDVARGWLLDVLRLPGHADVGFVTGATVANASCMAAARDELLERAGWDAKSDGLFGAPPITVVVGENTHSTVRKSLGLIGLGSDRVVKVLTDDQGRIDHTELPTHLSGPVLVCAQAGEVNTGAFDPFDEIADWLAATTDNGWLHVDGAFGLWALADPSRTHLVAGLHRADSWATDGHKWLNVTYDCGIAIVAREGALRRTFSSVAGYLPPERGFEAMHHTPQSSQRARQVEVWAVLRTLGRSGVAELVQRASDGAQLIAEQLRGADFDVLNDVVINQVLLRYGSAATTEALIAEIQRDGRIWCGATQWRGETAMRVSVSSWKTTLDDAARAADVIVECARRLTPHE
ncbi:MAG: aspartate aminotransferase family protein [Ilumatobacter sp.]|uniref:pyridoxal phosphate-dependent decarboxylase family protein n=2 Tax=Ilumatobacter sp. TaxID=1967498 RepID=UPI001DC8D186|nr:aspartate aminotransferase family protein [Ilumatobacter sp.]MBT5277189.1 aspartate aminotransferase family protein [Ilumatobacter sp.]MBT5867011.1 aspartate aminotransferase family protein [Ilumatobacter sp.]MBT7428521.1 aspartate aminotransferase family protein [Ilumatobacter sp.]